MLYLVIDDCAIVVFCRRLCRARADMVSSHGSGVCEKITPSRSERGRERWIEYTYNLVGQSLSRESRPRRAAAPGGGGAALDDKGDVGVVLGIHYRGVQSEGGAVDGGSIT